MIKTVIVGYGNIGHHVLEALEAAPDFEVAGIVRRNGSDSPESLKNTLSLPTCRTLKPMSLFYVHPLVRLKSMLMQPSKPV